MLSSDAQCSTSCHRSSPATFATSARSWTSRDGRNRGPTRGPTATIHWCWSGSAAPISNKALLIQRAVDALSSLPVHAVVTLGQMLDAGEVTAADNVVVVRSAPHGAILQHASLAVSHCGHGTTMKALTAGVPIVCIPMGRDQNDTAARVTHHGAGVRLSPKASTDKIRKAIAEVLDHDRYRSNAMRLASSIQHERGSIDIVDELEAVVRTTAASPLLRSTTDG